MALKPIGIEDDDSFPGRPGRALSRLIVDPAESDPVIKYFLTQVRSRGTTPVKIVLEGSSTANGGIVTVPAKKLVDRLSALTTKNPVRTTLADATATDIQWYETAAGGTQADTYITSTEVTELGNVKPTLMIHMIGSNDYGVQKDPAVFLSQLRSVLDSIKAVTPNTRHLFITHQAKNDMTPSTYTFDKYVDQMWTLSRENPGLVSVIDLSKEFQRIGVPGPDVWGLVSSDNVHLDAWGSKILAYMIAEALGIPTPPDNTEIYSATGHAASGNKTGGFIHHIITIPPRPYPREGSVQGFFYLQAISGTSNDEIRYYKGAGSGANSTLHTLYHRVNPTTEATTHIATTHFYIASHETMIIEGYLGLGSGNTVYVSGNANYTNSFAQVYPV